MSGEGRDAIRLVTSLIEAAEMGPIVLVPDGDQAGVPRRYAEGLRTVVHVRTRWRTIVPRREKLEVRQQREQPCSLGPNTYKYCLFGTQAPELETRNFRRNQ